VSAIVTLAAFPVAALVLWTLLRSRLGERLVAEPSGERWHERATPLFGGVGIFAGFAAGVLIAVAAGAVEPTSELFGILAGCTLLFLAGLADDVFTLRPWLKLAAQFGAAGIVLASGLSVEIVGNNVLATLLALLWLVGITNAFNLLDNMDGLAATLAAIACAYYALDAATEHPNRVGLVLALSLGFALVGFLPFNLRPGRSAAVFMGDSGSQVLGFALASLALSSSWKVAGTTLATTVLPLLVLAIPILDTTLVTIVRLIERRPVTQGGRDHTSHRLVYYGLSEGKAVSLLALLAAMLGATGLAYNVLGNGRVTTIGVLFSFILLVQFASYLGDLEERSRRGEEQPRASLRGLFIQPRRLVELLVDFTVICGSFLVAYLLQVEGQGTDNQKAIFLAALPILLGVRYLLFVLLGIYRRVWRFAGGRDWLALTIAVAVSAPLALGVLSATRPLGDFPREVFFVDALLCLVLVGASRMTLRVLPRLDGRRGERQRVLVVGAGRSGRSLARELSETAGKHVIGFLDDNARIRRRRIQGVTVMGSLLEAEHIIAAAGPDEVLVTIPDASRGSLDAVVAACNAAGITCRFVRREMSVDPGSLVEATTK
jgi:UDP-GlcNAc:undecaprenyl-phosphate GlcNAc-1-phosphate transferase